MTSPLRAARAAFVFLTRIPLGGFPYTPDEWRWAPAYFPLVGALLGSVTGLVFQALRPLGAGGAAYLALGVSLLLTGAFHEDGLADTSDALGGGYDRAKLFAILKDSRVGAFGASALVISIAGRAALLGQIDGRAVGALALVGAAARAVPVWQIVALPYATPDGAKSGDVMRASLAQAVVASGWPLLLGGALVVAHRVEVWRVLALLGVAALTGVVTGWRYRRRAGGVTGDFLGATEQLCELAGFAVMAWSAAWPA
jgi:adenosylcobinamide-GDP ribazoletransferase